MAFNTQNILSRLKELSCEEVAVKLGIDVKHHRALCFMHSDQHPSLAFFGSKRDSWYCFVCKKGGNAIDLVREKNNCGFVDACTWLCHKFNIDMGEKTLKSNSKDLCHVLKMVTKESMKPFVKEVAQFVIDNSKLTDIGSQFLFDERKLAPEVISHLHIVSLDNPWDIVKKLKNNFDEETLKNSGFLSVVNDKHYLRIFTPCLLFPYYDVQGILIGIQSRYLGDKKDAPRFQFLASQKTHLFNLPILREMRINDELYISEGITDCLALLSSGKKAIAIPSASILPENELMKLVKYKLRMYPDRDNAGARAFHTLQSFFIKQLNFLKAVQLPDGCKDYSDFYKERYGSN